MVEAVAVAEPPVQVRDAGDELGQVASGRRAPVVPVELGPHQAAALEVGVGGHVLDLAARELDAVEHHPMGQQATGRHDAPRRLLLDHHPVGKGGRIAQMGPHPRLVGGPEGAHFEGHDGLDVGGSGRSQREALLHPGDAIGPLASGYGQALRTSASPGYRCGSRSTSS